MKLTRALLVLVAVCTTARADQLTDRCKDLGCIRERIQRQMQQEKVPALSVAVTRKGEFLWEESFGFADLATRVPATKDTMYSLASITKPMTATAVMALVRDGKVDLDRPIDDYLGQAKLTARMGDAKEATVRRVLNHTSGLPVHAHFFYADETERRPSMDLTIQRYANLIRPPAERYQYSNLGYGLLDFVVSRVSGRSYADFMQQQVFAPLGMKHSVVADAHTVGATRYDVDGTPVPYYDFDHPGASAVFASAGDVARFGMFH
ncbi:serine hydrolase domain-containing protein, partial [Steroidobacter sp.]|uniref:serine hydrolase domain-containing protein n=1 Tax=Steroidobacter sp. TaxID=1978227 RepID=UPI001A43B3F0